MRTDLRSTTLHTTVGDANAARGQLLRLPHPEALARTEPLRLGALPAVVLRISLLLAALPLLRDHLVDVLGDLHHPGEQEPLQLLDLEPDTLLGVKILEPVVRQRVCLLVLVTRTSLEVEVEAPGLELGRQRSQDGQQRELGSHEYLSFPVLFPLPFSLPLAYLAHPTS